MYGRLFCAFWACLFVVFSLFAQAQEQAREIELISCPGKNLLDGLDKAVLRDIQTKADRVLNGQGRFWRIEKEGVPPSWLLGTLNDYDPHITVLSPAEQAAFDTATHIALKSREIIEAKKIWVESLISFPFPDHLQEETLKLSMTDTQFAAFNQALARHDISTDKTPFTPWKIWLVLASSRCQREQIEQKGRIFYQQQMGWEDETTSADVKYLDDKLRDKAIIAGKRLMGLETMSEQMLIMDNVPLDFVILMIDQLADYRDRLDDLKTTITELYLKGNIGAILPTLSALNAEGFHAASVLTFTTLSLDERNARMAERSKPLLDQGNAFIAVGALHLVGESGLVERFRHMGYEVTRVE